MRGQRISSILILLALTLVLSSGGRGIYHTVSSEPPGDASTAKKTGTAGVTASEDPDEVFLPPAQRDSDGEKDRGREWYTLAANPQRTSWVSEEVRGDLHVEWYRPIEPYIPYKVQIIAANGKLYISTARGLYAIDAASGNVDWVYPTELPLGHSPTVATVNGKSTVYVGGFDRTIHAIDATTGQDISGYSPYEAGAGFETNPLVIDNVIYAGNRDGYFYALDAITGALRWRYKTDGPILFSAAYKNGVIYFASNDAHAYALEENGSLVWQSQKLAGAGFNSFWPVVYTEKLTGKDYVIFTGSENYRGSEMWLQSSEGAEFFPDCFDPANACPWGDLIGPTATAPTDDKYWAPGTALIDVSRISDYYEDYPWRSLVFVLDSANGQEYTFDSDNDGKPERIPITWAGGVTNSGNKYPPVINDVDGIYYQDIIYESAPWIPRGDVVGWKFGTHFVSRVQDKDLANAIDEPMSFSSGGKLIYWSLCCDREAGAYDVTIPYGQPNRSWHYITYDLINQAPDYQPMYFDGNTDTYNNMVGYQQYSGKNQSKNGVYGKVGTTQSPPIPYQGKVYFLKGNTVIAFSPTASSPTKLPLAPIVATQKAPRPLSTTEVQQRLETEVQKMISAGHLRPGYHSAGFIDLYGVGNYTNYVELGEIWDYFQNPADTVVTLIQALPYLSSALQERVKTYLQDYYGPSGEYPLTRIVHVGWRDGAAREVYDIPQDVLSKYASFGPRTTSICGECGYWKSFPPYSFYGAWKYAQVFGNAKTIFDEMSSKLEAPPSDSYLTEKPYMLNLYIAGYLGYLQLQELAGYPQDTTVQSTYSHLIALRAENFSKDTPYASGFKNGYNSNPNTLSVARNFMFLTPELADYLNQNAYTKVQDAVSEYSYVAPYWFVSKFDDSYGEGTLQHLYDYPALFQAKAYILKEPYDELVKWLDVPAFYQGDLFYIQNLVAALQASPTSAGLQINGIADNRSSYSNSQVPKYEKFEITFQINNSVAKNLQMPYDASPSAGVEPDIGISVNAEFSQDSFQTVYTQPAFYYQDFDHQTSSGREWIYPSGSFSWKVRFAPTNEGTWQYRLIAQDASGIATSQPQSFTVTASANHGFVRVAKNDPRYFEFEDGTYFPGLGYNMSFNHINWLNPILDNQADFQKMSQNGIQLIRTWLSAWSIYGSAWNPWYGLRGDYDGYIPRTGLTQFSAYAGDPVTVKMKLAYAEDASGNKNTSWFEACRFLGTTGASPVAIKRNTIYHFRIKFRAYDISGPRNSAFTNYGFVVKVQNPNDGNWHTDCYEPGTNNSTGQVISAYAHSTDDWSYLEGDWNFGENDFLPNFYLALENVNGKDPTTGGPPSVFIDTVEIREKLPDGTLGPNIVSKPSMEHQFYFEQRNSYAFDKVLDLARQYGIYLKLVISEKNDVVFNWIDYNGNYVDAFDNNLFYGDYRNVTKIRWLQQAWWRYLQARWGYSTNIHSWELLNEGDPYNSRHYALADELGKYMRQFAPNNHLVTTSFWHSFPKDEFWANPAYPNTDYADIHRYIFSDADQAIFYDSALATLSLSSQIGAKTAGGANKPTVRGETGFVENGDTGAPTAQFDKDTQGIWLHKFIWGQINPNGALESYWYDTPHIYTNSFDHRDIFGIFYEFIKAIPLNNGHYGDIQAVASDPNVRVVGQKDPVCGRAHLWIDNKNHTWKNVVDGVAITPASGTISFSGMPRGTYIVTWFDTFAGNVDRTESIAVGTEGNLTLTLPQAVYTDVAVKADRQGTAESCA